MGSKLNSKETWLVIPDSQNGFRNNEPLHDRKAWEAALWLASNDCSGLELDHIVMLGDMIDFSALSRFRHGNDLTGTTKKSVEETMWWMERMPADSIPTTWIMGNHEQRLTNTLLDTSRDLAEVVTFNSVFNTDALGISVVGPYGQNIEHRGVIYDHGDKWATWGGQTAAKYLSKETKSIVYGHCHKHEMACKTYRGRQTFAASPGTIARVDGIVPGVKAHPDWQQGFCLVHYDGNRSWVEMIPFISGVLYFRGVAYPMVHNARARKADLGF